MSGFGSPAGYETGRTALLHQPSVVLGFVHLESFSSCAIANMPNNHHLEQRSNPEWYGHNCLVLKAERVELGEKFSLAKVTQI